MKLTHSFTNHFLLSVIYTTLLVSTASAETPVAVESAKPSIGKLYWVGGNQLTRANLDGSQLEVLATKLDAPDGVVLDLLANRVYWSNMGLNAGGPRANDEANRSNLSGSLQRASLDGTTVPGDSRYLVPPGNFQTGKEIEIDPITQTLYWADRDGKAVMIANADGSNVRAFIRKFKNAAGDLIALENPIGIALDTGNSHLYFTDRFMGKIMRAGLTMPAGDSADSRSDVTVLFNGVAMQDRLIDIDIDLHNRHMYWTDRGRHHIARADLDGKNVRVLVSPQNHTIKDPIGISLDLAQGKMIWTDMVTHAIHRANLDGSNIETILSGDILLNGVGYGPLGISLQRLQPEIGPRTGGQRVAVLGDNFVADNTQVFFGRASRN